MHNQLRFESCSNKVCLELHVVLHYFVYPVNVILNGFIRLQERLRRIKRNEEKAQHAPPPTKKKKKQETPFNSKVVTGSQLHMEKVPYLKKNHFAVRK